MKINWFKLNFKDIKGKFITLLISPYCKYFNEFRTLLVIGKRCKDCDNIYFECNCNDYLKLDNSEIINFIIDFIYKNITKRQYANIAYDINLRQIQLEKTDILYLYELKEALYKYYENQLV